MTFESILAEHFPGAIDQDEFVPKTLEALSPHGFTAENTIACVAVCRDELCTGLKLDVRHTYGEAFNMSSLAGMVFCGATSFNAAQAHSPVDQDKERYVYFAASHIAIGAKGDIGIVARSGRDGDSYACGALWALLGEMRGGRIDLRRDKDDIEYSLLRESILRHFAWGSEPTLVELTKAARTEALETLERMVKLTQTKKADHAIFSGVQIHTPDDRTLMWTPTRYALVDGKRQEIEI
jgi:hypothetical protein